MRLKIRSYSLNSVFISLCVLYYVLIVVIAFMCTYALQTQFKLT